VNAPLGKDVWCQRKTGLQVEEVSALRTSAESQKNSSGVSHEKHKKQSCHHDLE
jgi:hypothetical protein